MSRQRLSVHTQSELIAAIPVFLGYHPSNSLVIMTFTGDDPPLVGLCLRVELLTADEIEPAIPRLMAAIDNSGTERAHLFVVDDTTTAPTAAHRALVARLRTALDSIAVEVTHAVWTHSTNTGAHWTCLERDDCAGQVPESATTTFAASAALNGQVIFADRAELEGVLAPEHDEVLHQRQALLDDASPVPSAPEPGLAMIHAAVTSTAMPTADDDIAALGAALSEPAVRDACLSYGTSPLARAAEQLWLTLARGLPASHRADPAALLAVSAYLRGDGVLANVAVGYALQAQPTHTLATLVRHAIGLGIHPLRLRELISDVGGPAMGVVADDESA